jgi:hypothetical protein
MPKAVRLPRHPEQMATQRHNEHHGMFGYAYQRRVGQIDDGNLACLHACLAGIQPRDQAQTRTGCGRHGRRHVDIFRQDRQCAGRLIDQRPPIGQPLPNRLKLLGPDLRIGEVNLCHNESVLYFSPNSANARAAPSRLVNFMLA